MVPIDRPAPVAPWLAPPDMVGSLLPHKDIMSNFPTLPYVRAGALAVGDCSDKAPCEKET